MDQGLSSGFLRSREFLYPVRNSVPFIACQKSKSVAIQPFMALCATLKEMKIIPFGFYFHSRLKENYLDKDITNLD
ncbi:MAG TPA: hypothetical protein VM123_04085 [archaeon]|nr:hypothetical protein [archaeon]